MRYDISIHTTISKDEKRRLLEYGKGSLKVGISNLIKIAESQTITVNVITEIEL